MDFLRRDEREQRVADFTRLVESKPHLQFAISQVQSMDELLALSRRAGAPLKDLDIVLNYRDMNEAWWPWFDRPKQDRRAFVHTGRFPEEEDNNQS